MKLQLPTIGDTWIAKLCDQDITFNYGRYEVIASYKDKFSNWSNSYDIDDYKHVYSRMITNWALRLLERRNK